MQLPPHGGRLFCVVGLQHMWRPLNCQAKGIANCAHVATWQKGISNTLHLHFRPHLLQGGRQSVGFGEAAGAGLQAGAAGLERCRRQGRELVVDLLSPLVCMYRLWQHLGESICSSVCGFWQFDTYLLVSDEYQATTGPRLAWRKVVWHRYSKVRGMAQAIAPLIVENNPCWVR